jgi:hypothetical protein
MVRTIVVAASCMHSPFWRMFTYPTRVSEGGSVRHLLMVERRGVLLNAGMFDHHPVSASYHMFKKREGDSTHPILATQSVSIERVALFFRRSTLCRISDLRVRHGSCDMYCVELHALSP